MIFNFQIRILNDGSSYQRCSKKKGVLRNFSKFTGKHLCQSLFFNKVAGLKKRLWHRRFHVNFAKFLVTPLYRTPLDDCLCNEPFEFSDIWQGYLFNYVSYLFYINRYSKKIIGNKYFYYCFLKLLLNSNNNSTLTYRNETE